MPNVCSSTSIKDNTVETLRKEINFLRKQLCQLSAAPIITAPNGTRYRVVVSNGGVISAQAV